MAVNEDGTIKAASPPKAQWVFIYLEWSYHINFILLILNSDLFLFKKK